MLARARRAPLAREQPPARGERAELAEARAAEAQQLRDARGGRGGRAVRRDHGCERPAGGEAQLVGGVVECDSGELKDVQDAEMRRAQRGVAPQGQLPAFVRVVAQKQVGDEGVPRGCAKRDLSRAVDTQQYRDDGAVCGRGQRGERRDHGWGVWRFRRLG